MQKEIIFSIKIPTSELLEMFLLIVLTFYCFVYLVECDGNASWLFEFPTLFRHHVYTNFTDTLKKVFTVAGVRMYFFVKK